MYCVDNTEVGVVGVLGDRYGLGDDGGADRRMASEGDRHNGERSLCDRLERGRATLFLFSAGIGVFYSLEKLEGRVTGDGRVRVLEPAVVDRVRNESQDFVNATREHVVVGHLVRRVADCLEADSDTGWCLGCRA